VEKLVAEKESKQKEASAVGPDQFQPMAPPGAEPAAHPLDKNLPDTATDVPYLGGTAQEG